MFILIPLRDSSRSASPLKAGLRGSSIEKNLKRGYWPIKSASQRFYENIIVKQGPKYQDMVFHPAQGV